MMKFYGNSVGNPFENTYDASSYILAFDEKQGKFSFLTPKTKEEDTYGWPLESVIESIKDKSWEEVPDCKVKKLFNSFGYEVPTSLDIPFRPILNLPQIAAVPAKPKKSMATKSFTLKKGSLYFNTTSNQIERVITIQDGSLIWSSRHKHEAKPYPRTAFRLANQVEVNNYLSEAQTALT